MWQKCDPRVLYQRERPTFNKKTCDPPELGLFTAILITELNIQLIYSRATIPDKCHVSNSNWAQSRDPLCIPPPPQAALLFLTTSFPSHSSFFPANHLLRSDYSLNDRHSLQIINDLDSFITRGLTVKLKVTGWM